MHGLGFTSPEDTIHPLLTLSEGEGVERNFHNFPMDVGTQPPSPKT